MPKPIRVLIADDHPVVRFGLTQLLNAESDLEVVGEASSAEEAVRQIKRLKPDVTILDMEMGESRGADTLRAVRALSANARIVVYTAFDDGDRVAEAIALGAQGYLLKESANHELARAVRVVHSGGTILEPTVASRLMARMRAEKSQASDLSERERQVLSLMTEGKSNRGIAQSLYITERTVKFHVSAILTKLRASNRTEAVLIAAQRGLVDFTHKVAV